MSAIPSTVRARVLLRDGYACIAPQLDRQAGWCMDAFGNRITRWPGRDPGPQYLQMSHTKDADALSMSKKAESDEQHLVALCPFHHTGTAAGSNWEAVNRNRIRQHLEELYSTRKKR